MFGAQGEKFRAMPHGVQMSRFGRDRKHAARGEPAARVHWVEKPGARNVFSLSIAENTVTRDLDAMRRPADMAGVRVVPWPDVYDALVELFGGIPAGGARGGGLFLTLYALGVSREHVEHVLRAVETYTQHPEWPRMAVSIASMDARHPALQMRLTRWMYPPTRNPIGVASADMLDDGVSTALAVAHPRVAATRTPAAAYLAERAPAGLPVRYSRLVLNGTATTRAYRPAQAYRDAREVWLNRTPLAPGQALQTRLHEKLAKRVQRGDAMAAFDVRSVGGEFPGAYVMPTAWTALDTRVVVLTVLSGEDAASDMANVRRTVRMYGDAGAQLVWACHNDSPLKYLQGMLPRPPRFFQLDGPRGNAAQLAAETQFLDPAGAAPETALDWAAYFQWAPNAERAPELRAGATGHTFERERLARHILYDQILYTDGGELKTFPLRTAAEFHNLLAGASAARLARLVRRAGLVNHMRDAAAFLTASELRWTTKQCELLWKTHMRNSAIDPPEYKHVAVFPLFDRHYRDTSVAPPSGLPEFATLRGAGFAFVRYSDTHFDVVAGRAADAAAELLLVTERGFGTATTQTMDFFVRDVLRVPGRTTWVFDTVTTDFYIHVTRLRFGSAVAVVASEANRRFAIALADKICAAPAN